MSKETLKVRIVERVGDPSTGVSIQTGAVVDLPTVWAERYINQGKAVLVEPPPKKKNAKSR